MFWTQFTHLCACVGKSPNAVAAEIGIPSGSITAWSKGTQPRNATVKKIAKYFGVTEEYLLHGIKHFEGEEIKKDTALASDVDAELFEIWNTADDDERRDLLEMARMLKARRSK